MFYRMKCWNCCISSLNHETGISLTNGTISYDKIKYNLFEMLAVHTRKVFPNFAPVYRQYDKIRKISLTL